MVSRFEITVFVIMAVIGTMITLAPIANATHLWTGHKWVKSIYYCIDPKFSSTLNGAIRQAASDVNSQPSKFILNRQSWDSSCINHVKYCTMNVWFLGYYYMTYNLDGTIKQADICVTNAPVNKLDNSACVFNSGHYNLRYIMHHEFSHWLEMKHFTKSEPTIMWPNYSCIYWAGWSTHDKDTWKFVYPDTVSSLSTQSTDKGIGGHSHEQNIPQIPIHRPTTNNDNQVHSGALQPSHNHKHFDSIANAKENMKVLRNNTRVKP